MALELRAVNQAVGIQNQQNYAPAIQIERKKLNIIQRIVSWFFSFFCNINFNRQASRSMRDLFAKRIELHREDPASFKAISALQKYLRRGTSQFQESGIRMDRLMDPTVLQIALHEDPQQYLVRERGKLESFRVLSIQRLAQTIKNKVSETEPKCDELIEKAPNMSAEELRIVIEELRAQGVKAKLLTPLEEILSFMELDPAELEAELTAHYLGALQRQEKLTLMKLTGSELSKGEVRALEILSQRLIQLEKGNLRPIDPMDLKRLRRFYDGAAGNLELNKRLINYADKHQHLMIFTQAIELALDITYKIAQGETYFCVMGKVKKIGEKLETAQPVTSEERLNLKEVKQVESLARLHHKFQQLSQIGVPVNDSLVPLAEKADQFVRSILEKAEQERPHKSGACMFYDYPNADEYLNWPGGCLRKFAYKYLIPWPLVHASIAISHEGENWNSHMYHGHHAFMRRSIGDYSFKTFELDFKKLIKEPGKKLLQAKLGPNWENEVEKIFGDISGKIHTNDLLAKFHNPPIRQILAAVSIGYGLFDNHAMEHRPLNRQQICSSFVLNTSLQALASLEVLLTERCSQEAGPPIPAGFKFIEIPIPRKRLLDFVLPHQLPKILPFSREVDAPPIIKKVVNFYEFEMQAR